MPPPQFRVAPRGQGEPACARLGTTWLDAGAASALPIVEPGAVEPEAFHLSPNGWVPNNPHLPALLYRAAISSTGLADPAAIFEQTFARNGWQPQWRNDVYAFHHYHTNTHELLGFVQGSATLVLGGESGPSIRVAPGDVLVLPAGIGHCKTAGSPDFLAVGAYPPGPQWDTCCSAPSPSDIARMQALPLPGCDPILGLHGPLTRHWHCP